LNLRGVISSFSKRFLTEIYPEHIKPLIMSVVVTKRCVLDCIMCSARESVALEPSTKKLLAWVTDLMNFSVKGVHLTGGEPTLRAKELLPLIRKIKNLGLSVSITTNGQILGDEVTQLLLLMDEIHISVHGLREVHDKITNVNGSFDRAIKTLYTVVDSGIPTYINFVLQTLNVKELPKIVELAESVGVNGVCILPVELDSYVFKNKIDDSLRAFDIEELIDIITEISHRSIIKNSPQFFSYLISKIKDPNISRRCFHPFLQVHIDANGDIYPCCACKSPIGNLDKQSFREIYESEKYKKFRKNAWGRKCPIKSCFAMGYEETQDRTLLPYIKKLLTSFGT